MDTAPRRSIPASNAAYIPFPDPDCDGIADFRNKLSCFTGEHYMASQKPYVFLLSAARSKVVYYDQFSEVLIADAIEKGADGNHVTAQISHFKHEYLLPENYGIPILNLINNINSDDQSREKISIVPLMCGAGKSTAISYKIKEVLETVDGTPEHTDGILIVTDSIERMEEYIEPDQERDPELYRYLVENRHRIALLQHGDDWRTSVVQRMERPVLIISTQRYFQTPKEKIEQNYLQWNHGCRPLIIFDERIPLKEVVQIDRTAINTVASALSDRIEYAIADSEDEDRESEGQNDSGELDPHVIRWENKKWCIGQWENIRTQIYEKIDELERLYDTDDYYLYCDWSLETLTEDDERFWNFIKKNRRYLFMDGCDVMKVIRAVFSMMKTGTIYHCMKKENQYENVFSIVIDNTDLITDLTISDSRNAKVIVLDGTGDVHPDTALQPLPDHIDMRNEFGNKYRRWLDMLTIHFVDEATGKISLTGKDSGDKKKRLRAYLKKLRTVSADNSLPEGTLPVVFTYQSVERYFKNARFKTEHFNNIKGKNDYRKERLIAQVGLNRTPLWYGLAYYLAAHPEWRAALAAMDLGETNAEIQNILANSAELHEINARFLLTDLEQNMFRCAIRNSNFIQTAHYYILTKTGDAVTEKLLVLMHERYDPCKAAIIPNETMPAEFAKPERATIKGEILRFFNENKGPFTIRQIIEGVALLNNVQQFRTARKSPELKEVIVKIPGTQTYDLLSRTKVEV